MATFDLTDEETRFSTPLVAAVTDTAYVRLTRDPSVGQPIIDDVAVIRLPEPSMAIQAPPSRLFQGELGRTFREHLAGLRLERAKALLRATEMSVIEVAGETGWSSLAHFNSVFRRRVGATPRQFRIGASPAPSARIAS